MLADERNHRRVVGAAEFILVAVAVVVAGLAPVLLDTWARPRRWKSEACMQAG